MVGRFSPGGNLVNLGLPSPLATQHPPLLAFFSAVTLVHHLDSLLRALPNSAQQAQLPALLSCDGANGQGRCLITVYPGVASQ